MGQPCRSIKRRGFAAGDFGTPVAVLSLRKKGAPDMEPLAANQQHPDALARQRMLERVIQQAERSNNPRGTDSSAHEQGAVMRPAAATPVGSKS
jgi:hypothetical protein